MKIKFYIRNKCVKEEEFNDDETNCIFEILEKASKIGGKYYLFTTEHFRWIELFDKTSCENVNTYKLKDIRKNQDPPYIVTEKIFIFYDDTILEYKKLYENLDLSNSQDYKIFYEKLTNFILI